MSLSKVFKDCLLPLSVECGKCLFYITVVSGICVLVGGKNGKSVKNATNKEE